MFMAVHLLFQPSGQRVRVEGRKTVLEAARANGVSLTAVCGGHGTCGKCRVRLLAGGLSMRQLVEKGYVNGVTREELRVLSKSEIQQNIRLACRVYAARRMTIEVPEESRETRGVILGAAAIRISVHPCIRDVRVRLVPPSLEDFRSDAERLADGVASELAVRAEAVTLSYPLLVTLPKRLRQWKWQVRAIVRELPEARGWEIIDVLPLPKEGMAADRLYGIAVDLGTTTIAATLADLKTGRVLAHASRMNSQIRMGDDVVSRISYAMMHEGGGTELTEAVRSDLRALALELAAKAQVPLERIYEMVVAGNTVMGHLFLGLDPEAIGKSPFISVTRVPLDLPAAALGLGIAPAANVHALPVEAGFVGADNVAVLLATRLIERRVPTMVIDIGTNGEIAYGDHRGIFTTSCATGPALEGAEISCGMRAAEGAIEHVTIAPDTYEPVLQVIGSAEPRGICGSGIIDLCAELARTGLIGADGTFRKDLDTPRLRPFGKHSRAYVLYEAPEGGRDIVVTQKDVRAVQLAKGALYAGAVLLIRARGGERPRRIELAGAFGSYIDKKQARRIGMFPADDDTVIDSIGNAAGAGALIALLDSNERRRARDIARSVHFVEAASQKDFQMLFYKGTLFPMTKKEA